MFPLLYFAISVGSFSPSSPGSWFCSPQTFGHFHPSHIQQTDIRHLGLGNSWLSIYPSSSLLEQNQDMIELDCWSFVSTVATNAVCGSTGAGAEY